MKYVYFLLSLLFSLNSFGQKIGSLKIGDTVPNIQFKVIDKEMQELELNDYKGSLILLDFWASWCGPCYGGLIRADSLQRQFGDKIKIIAVNSKNRRKHDEIAKVKNYYENILTKHPDFRLAIAVDDTLALLLFPNTAIPHYVWITPEGTVGAITSGKYVTGENISKFLSGNYPRLPVKDDLLRKAQKEQAKKEKEIHD